MHGCAVTLQPAAADTALLLHTSPPCATPTPPAAGEDGPITIHYNGYSEGGKVGVPATLEVDLVIGADGANSRVAKEIDAGEYDYAIAFQERIRIPGEGGGMGVGGWVWVSVWWGGEHMGRHISADKGSVAGYGGHVPLLACQ